MSFEQRGWNEKSAYMLCCYEERGRQAARSISCRLSTNCSFVTQSYLLNHKMSSSTVSYSPENISIICISNCVVSALYQLEGGTYTAIHEMEIFCRSVRPSSSLSFATTRLSILRRSDVDAITEMNRLYHALCTYVPPLTGRGHRLVAWAWKCLPEAP